MGAYKANPDEPIVIVYPHYESVIVSFDVKYNPVII
jgi:hypothetical protein